MNDCKKGKRYSNGTVGNSSYGSNAILQGLLRLHMTQTDALALARGSWSASRGVPSALDVGGARCVARRKISPSAVPHGVRSALRSQIIWNHSLGGARYVARRRISPSAVPHGDRSSLRSQIICDHTVYPLFYHEP